MVVALFWIVFIFSAAVQLQTYNAEFVPTDEIIVVSGLQPMTNEYSGTSDGGVE